MIMEKLVYVLAALCAGMSLALFCLMGADKRLAKAGARRVPEKRLFTFAVLGGGVGGLLGMYCFRHKTKHWYFVLGFWALALLQLSPSATVALRLLTVASAPSRLTAVSPLTANRGCR